jgi:hypothetical protein
MEDPVGLVDPPVHRDAQDDAVRTGLEELDVEQIVDTPAATSERRRVAWEGGGCGHRRMLTARR